MGGGQAHSDGIVFVRLQNLVESVAAVKSAINTKAKKTGSHMRRRENAPFRGIGIQVLNQPAFSTRFYQIH